MEPVAVAVVVGALLALVLTTLLMGWSRRRTLTSRVGSFLCQLHDLGAGTGQAAGDVPQGPPGTSGVAQYGKGRLVWWRAVSLAPRPARVWDRASLEVVGRTEVEGVDAHGRPLVRIRCRHKDQSFDLTLGAGAAAGLVSWVESAPRHVGRVH